MDPDYDHVGAKSEVGHWDTEKDHKADRLNRISKIVECQFRSEIDGLESDIFEIDRRINESRLMLDRLRAAMVISYYDKSDIKGAQLGKQQNTGIHPTVKEEIGKSIPKTHSNLSRDPHPTSKTLEKSEVDSHSANETEIKSKTKDAQANTSPHASKYRVIVGNVSQYIPVSSRQSNDQVLVELSTVIE